MAGRPRGQISEKKRRARMFGKMGGRPTGFKDEMIEQARQLVAQGYTDYQIAEFFGRDKATIWRWKQKVPDFGRAFLRGEKQQKETLEAAMFHRGTGYTHEAVKIFPPREITTGTGKNKKTRLTKPIIVKYQEHYAPDPKAAELLLRKLDPANYSTRVVHTGDPAQPVVFNMLNRPPKEE